MSTTDTVTDEAYDALPTEPDEIVHHPTEALYVKVAIILALITAVEISTYLYDWGPAHLPALMVMMVVKFAMVIGFFMHLRFDNKLFTWVFVAGLALAVAVYIVMLTTFSYWQNL